MVKRMPIWGVGPKIMVPTFGYLVLVGIATYLWPSTLLIHTVPYILFLIPGVVLLAIGLPMLVVAVVSVKRAYKKDELATRGIFGIVRNPIYSAWIVFNIPGLVLLLRSWPMFLAPLIGYCLFKMLVGKEEKYLQERFGQAYDEYKARVPELFPWPRKPQQHRHGIPAWMRMPCSPFGTLLAATFPILAVLIGLIFLALHSCVAQ